MAYVILKMSVHCQDCAVKIRKAIKKMFGVEKVWVSLDTGLVVIAGTVDAMALRGRLRRKTGKSVTIVSDGTPEPPPAAPTRLVDDDDDTSDGCCSVQ